MRWFASTVMSSTDCYFTLGISFGASEEKIKEAYRKLVKVHHPDLGGSSDKFVKIQTAYENLMDPVNRKSSSASSSSSSASSSNSYWRSWDTSSTWWNTSSNRNDDEADFEEQWRKFTAENRQKQKYRKFRSKTSLDDDDDDDNYSKNDDRESSYKSEKRESSTNTRSGRRGNRRTRETSSLADKISLSGMEGCVKSARSVSAITGEYLKISNFNGRVCYMNKPKSLFLFWSNRGKDWKISSNLRDDEDCIAFNDRGDPSCDSPFESSNRWMIWSDRNRRYLSANVTISEVEDDDYTEWTIDELRSALTAMGLGENLKSIVEKSELIDMMKIWRPILGTTKSNDPRHRRDHDDHSRSSRSVPVDHLQLCSRQRHDGIVQSPPLMSEKCNIAKNRVEKFVGKLEDLEKWLLKFGDRRRFYGAYDSENNYCFGLIWKDNKLWARAGKHEY